MAKPTTTYWCGQPWFYRKFVLEQLEESGAEVVLLNLDSSTKDAKDKLTHDIQSNSSMSVFPKVFLISEPSIFPKEAVEFVWKIIDSSQTVHVIDSSSEFLDKAERHRQIKVEDFRTDINRAWISGILERHGFSKKMAKSISSEIYSRISSYGDHELLLELMAMTLGFGSESIESLEELIPYMNSLREEEENYYAFVNHFWESDSDEFLRSIKISPIAPWKRQSMLRSNIQTSSIAMDPGKPKGKIQPFVHQKARGHIRNVPVETITELIELSEAFEQKMMSRFNHVRLRDKDSLSNLLLMEAKGVLHGE